ncbi:MAG: 2-oxoacid:acceptor oxidoreductase subunit alpha [Acidimicrobiales bacterium]|nr:2-oxoacid:acceptor oxidoreductase subunit alpha [Acidimicrobiales bacterium]
MTSETHTVETQSIDRVVLRFAGDSGDGMQLTGDRFTESSAIFGNDLATFPNYPAEIRAPAGTLAGVSAFQVHIADHDILTPGDSPNVLIAMNPAALKANIGDVESGGVLIVNSDAFDERSLTKAGYGTNPLVDGSLDGYIVYEVPMTSMTIEAAKDTGAKPRDAERSKNFFALGLVSWMYSRPENDTLEWIANRYKGKDTVIASNVKAFKAGHAFGETAEIFSNSFVIKPAHLEPGEYTNITGNQAAAWGVVAAGYLSGLQVFLGSYPITPASDILHELSKLRHHGVKTFQAEDEIAGIGAALGAAYGGALGVTTTSGPGMDLKSETIGLAVSLELPLLIIDVQRAGPSTGLPTKAEQSDLLMALHGRHGESPVPIIAAMTPGHCFEATIEAVRIAITYRTPVILLTDGYLANSSEPWKLPDIGKFKLIEVNFATEPNHENPDGTKNYWPYKRDADTLAREWAIPGTPGMEHRIGGLEKADGSGAVSYEAKNHGLMVELRAKKIDAIANSIPLQEVDDKDGNAKTLVIGWGSTYGAIAAGVRRVRAGGNSVAHCHLTHMNPLPSNLEEIINKYQKVLVPEMNTGQLSSVLRAKFLVDAKSLTKVEGIPFKAAEIEQAILSCIKEES